MKDLSDLGLISKVNIFCHNRIFCGSINFVSLTHKKAKFKAIRDTCTKGGSVNYCFSIAS